MSAPAAGSPAGEPESPRRSDPGRAPFARCVDGRRSRRGSRGARRQGFRAVGFDRRDRPAAWTARRPAWSRRQCRELARNRAALEWRRHIRARRFSRWCCVRRSVVNNNTWTGRGIGVAVIDSGLEMTSDFSGRVTAFYDFTTGGTICPVQSPYDDYGHGTHVAGTIGGSGDRSNNRDYRGLAPNVKLVVLKVLDKNGAGYTSDVIRAVDFAVANRVSLGIQVINLSLGHPIFEPASSRSARPGRGARGTRRRDRRRSRRQLRQEPDDRPSRLRGRHVARQCAVGDHRRRGQDARHRRAQRRPHRRLQFGRPDVVRRIRQTRRRGARAQHRRGCREGRDLVQKLSATGG